MSTYKELLETTESALSALVDRFDLDEEKLLDKIEKLEDEIVLLREKVASKLSPAWGNCRNGCEASYLDTDGYCSPACAMGGRKGQHYSIGASA